MPQYITPITLEAEVFLGTVFSAEKFTGVQRRVETKTTPGPYGPETEHFEGPDGRVLQVGDVYVREVVETEPGTLTFGTWRYLTHSHSEEFKRMKAVAMNRQAQSAPGQPMRSPLGTPIVLADMTRPVQPGVGETQRDPWTGAEVTP